MFKIGSVEIADGAVLGPMAGITDMTFRALCREQGASLCCSEMISAKGLMYANRNTKALLETEGHDRPLSLQLFGSDPDIMADEAQKLEDGPYDIFDINMGCPMPKIVGNGEGCALMRNPALAGRIIERMARVLKKPVTVKIRAGFTENEINAVEIAKIAEASGAAAVCVHGRTRDQYYSGKADRNIIKRVKEAVNIPVIGSGDVRSASDADRMKKETGCDGVMIARAARGNPWIFREVRAYLKGEKLPERPGKEEVKEMILRQLLDMAKREGEASAARQMRKHAGFYAAGFSGAAAFRREINKAETIGDFERVLTTWQSLI